MLVSFVLFGVAPKNAKGTVTGPLPLLGFLSLVAAMVAGTTAAIRWRDAGVDRSRRDWIAAGMPSAARLALHGQARQQYRELSERDPVHARGVGVGRPDRGRDFDDGGLLDLNSLPVEALVEHAQLGREEAERLVAARQRMGRLSSVEELIVYAAVDAPTAERLRDYALFL